MITVATVLATVDSLTGSTNVLGADIPLASIYKKAKFDQP